MVKCKECGDEDYGVDMVVENDDFLCPTCATDYIKELKKDIKVMGKRIKDKDHKINSCPYCRLESDDIVFIEDIHKYFPDKYMCKKCATDAIDELKKEIEYLKSTHDWEDCCYDYKKSLLNRIKELNKDKDFLNQGIVNHRNWIGKVTEALNIPEESSFSRALERIKELKNA